jgi:uncharacterized protein (TIGR02646 family)
MKYIKKLLQEPRDFSTWKQQANPDWIPNWGNLSGKPKKALHSTLLAEQGYICCYCGRRINADTSHVEHFKPRSQFLDQTLDYQNLIASCPGYPVEDDVQKGDKNHPAQEHCGQRKGDWYDPELTVSPLIENCADFFRFTGDGQILPSQDPQKIHAATETIAHLRLDHNTLTRSRSKAIEAEIFELETLTPDEINKLINAYNQPNTDGQYIPFCATVLYLLSSYAG